MSNRTVIRRFIGTCTLAAMLLYAAAAPAAMTHRYSFSSDLSDTVGAAHGTAYGAAAVSGGRLALDGNDDYVQLPPTGPDGIQINTYTAVTLECWAAVDVQKSWATLLGFGSWNVSGADKAPVNFLQVWPKDGGDSSRTALNIAGAGQIAQTAALDYTAGPEHYIAMTFDDAADEMILYIDGVEKASNSAVTHSLSEVGTDWAQIGWNGYTQAGAVKDPLIQGAVNEIRIWNEVLSPDMIASHYAIGPDMLADQWAVGQSGGQTRVREGGFSDTVTVTMTEDPLGLPVTVSVSETSAVAQVTIQPSVLVFSPTDWQTPRTITVSAVDDAAMESALHQTTLMFEIAADPVSPYHGSTLGDIPVVIEENDCGVWGFSEADFNADCQINLADFAAFVRQWLGCSLPEPDCDDYRP